MVKRYYDHLMVPFKLVRYSGMDLQFKVDWCSRLVYTATRQIKGNVKPILSLNGRDCFKIFL